MSEFSVTLSKVSKPPPEYLPDFLRLFDEATLWLGLQGRTGQWGSETPSSSPAFVLRTANFLEKSRERDMTIIVAKANENAPVIGIIAFNEAPTPNGHAPPVEEREIYVHLLLTTRDPTYRGLGLRLFTEAKEEAQRRGINMLRLACYAGEDGKIIQVYERMGLRKNPDEVIMVPNWNGGAPWPKMMMMMKLEPDSR